LVAEQAYQQAKSALVQAQANRLSDTVALIQSLGGGWMSKMRRPKNQRQHPDTLRITESK